MHRNIIFRSLLSAAFMLPLLSANSAGAAGTDRGAPGTTHEPAATIRYAGSPYGNSGSALASQSGISGGSFHATSPDLVIDPANGDVDLEASRPGTYTVSYTAAGPDGKTIAASAQISIMAPGTATHATAESRAK